MFDQIKEEAILKEFKRKNRRYKMQSGNTWGTTKLEKRSQWYGELKHVMGDALHYKNYYECPICLSLNTLYDTNRAIDNYHYCENCYDQVRLAGGFDQGYYD